MAEVPFVDPLNTMLDPTLPLTVIEREEWGDPIADAEAFGWIQGYSPYENVGRARLPGDPRDGGPQRSAGRLPRADEVGGPPARPSPDAAGVDRPVLLKVEMGAGHGGPSGRYESWQDEAFVLAFVLDALGVAAADTGLRRGRL